MTSHILYLVLIEYRADLVTIDALMADHMAFLTKCYDAGVFIVSGRREPRTGGVILATAPSRDDVEAIMALDPFVANGAATFEVIAFRASQASAAFRALLHDAEAT